MKNIIILLATMVVVVSCNAPVKEAETTAPATTSIALPYTATYSSQFDMNVSDQDLLTVLDSYKAWENGDFQALQSTMGDSITFEAWDGTDYTGLTTGLIDKWKALRDSLSSVKIEMTAWTKSHSIDKKDDIILVWYKEIDTYKTGKIDSADWHDINALTNGKISYYAQFRKPLKTN